MENRTQHLFSVLSLLALFLLGCQTAGGEGESLSLERNQDVALAVEEEALPLEWVEASFLSSQQTFSYTFKYNSFLLQSLDVLPEKPEEFGPRFEVEGGAEIKGYTVLTEPQGKASPPLMVQMIGVHRVTRQSLADGDCTVQKARTDYMDETLVLELKLCPGDEEDLGEEALRALFDELSFQQL